MIKQILLSVLLVTSSAHAVRGSDYDQEDSARENAAAEEQRQREEAERQSQYYDTYTETDDNGNTTTTTSPRSVVDLLDTEMMTGSQRQAIFNEIVYLKTEALIKVNRAKDLQHSIIDVDAKAIFVAILTDCVVGCSGGTPVASCILCCTELMHSKYKSSCEFWEARSLVKEAEKLYKEAERLEDLLWYDDSAEDWT